MVFQEPMTSLDPVYTVGNQLEEAIYSHRKTTREEAKAMILEMLNEFTWPTPSGCMTRTPTSSRAVCASGS